LPPAAGAIDGPEAPLPAVELERFAAAMITDKAGRNFHEESRVIWRRAR
jgi:hypothetical protein